MSQHTFIPGDFGPYHEDRNCPCDPGSNHVDCSTHGPGGSQHPFTPGEGPYKSSECVECGLHRTQHVAPANPALISRVLKSAGLPKAGRYTAWGYVDREGKSADGFIVIGPKEYQRQDDAMGRKADMASTVCFTGRMGALWYEKAIAALEAEGYVIDRRIPANPKRPESKDTFDVIGRNA